MADQGIPRFSIVPGEVTPVEHFARLRQAVEPYVDSTPLRDVSRMPELPFIHQYHMGRLLFAETRMIHQRSRRDAGWIRRNDVGHVLVQAFITGGGASLHGGREYRTVPNGIVAANMCFELDAVLTDSHILTLVVPPEVIEEHLPVLRDVRGPLFAPGAAAGKVFADFLISLRRHLPDASRADAPVLTDAAIGLMASLLSKEDTSSAEASRGVLMAVQRHIDQRLGDFDLGADSLCAEFGLSRTSLFRMFEELGGVRGYIQRRRLMACFRALSEPRNRTRRIFDIALDYGFSNPSHLSVLFRSHFGMSPSEVREAAGDQFTQDGTAWRPPDGTGLSIPEQMRLWSRQLGSS
ncbi:AraC-type DNA-binding protein [Thalassobaculum litoreum DSM 18839]|uniref:AraC-type DNA-binding protein n=2 Tax=Thalassobaculum TaxID=526215 RepID=A0A8G2EVM0_9PROT|nr:AraC-type DNA-binding protein [Thalassobaculum litoreum DSM 18839]